MKPEFKFFPTIVYCLLFLFSLTLSSQSQAQEADALVGVWEPGHGKAKIKISKIGDKYYGKIVWLKEPKDENGNPKVDKNNPDESLKKTPTLGLRILKDFAYKGNNTWEEGTIYDPENGSTYNCTIKLKDANTLDVRGYIGVSMIGRTDTWVRMVKK